MKLNEFLLVILRLLELLLNAFLLLSSLLGFLFTQLLYLASHVVPLLQFARGSLDLKSDHLLVRGSIWSVWRHSCELGLLLLNVVKLIGVVADCSCKHPLGEGAI